MSIGGPSSVPSSDRLRVLTVGDGDLTLSLALARAYGDQLDLVASTLLKSSDDLVATYSNLQVLKELQERKVPIRYGVDATHIEETGNDKWDVILFHHPHLGPIVDEQVHAERHFSLLAHYFFSASKCLRPGGLVHVCLCGNQPQTWRVEQAAQQQGLVKVATTPTSAQEWLSPSLVALPVQSHYPAPRRYRNGKLGSKHFLGRYGYRHVRTHGKVSGVDINVSGSLHFMFQKDGQGEHKQVCRETQCRVCGMVFPSLQALQEHARAPALPDPVTTVSTINHSTVENDESTDERVDDDNTEPLDTFVGDCDKDDIFVEVSHNDPDCNHEIASSDDSFHVNVSEDSVGEIIFRSVVQDVHDGKRLKWYLRQSCVSDMGLSKHECTTIIKDERVAVNGKVATDSSRILRSGDRITLLDTVNDGTSTTTLVDIQYRSDNVLVVYKPVGIRTTGSFSSNTLEMMVSAHTGLPFKSVSKLDTGCAGLCILQRNGGTMVKDVSHVFTALVHGHVPDSWNGSSKDLPIESMRRWRKGGNGTKRLRHEVSDVQFDESTPSETGDKVELCVIEKTACSAETPALSTLRVTTSSKASGLCSAICFLLRKQGHPVVNDRSCRREYLSLPRSIRNLIKNRLCIGCYEVNMCIDGEEPIAPVSMDIPERVFASHWQRHCDAHLASASH